MLRASHAYAAWDMREHGPAQQTAFCEAALLERVVASHAVFSLDRNLEFFQLVDEPVNLREILDGLRLQCLQLRAHARVVCLQVGLHAGTTPGLSAPLLVASRLSGPLAAGRDAGEAKSSACVSSSLRGPY